MSRTEKVLILTGIFFFFLLNYPLAQLFNMQTMVFEIPLEVFYLFLVWILIICCLFLFGHWLKSSREPQS